MKFSEVMAQTLAWLQREGRVSYRALKLEFDLNDDVLEALKEELITVKELTVDKDGKMLVWIGQGSPASRVQRPASNFQKNQKAKIKSRNQPQPLASNPQGEVEREAEGCFQRAIEIAQRQQAKALELRAGMSLSRLWQQQGKTAEAHRMLSEIYNWFTEGFDTKDLYEAKTLVEELQSQTR